MSRLFVVMGIQLIVLIAVGRFVAAQQATVHDVPHKKVNYSCEHCHVATSFNDIRFDHSETKFELRGFHADATCLSCHNIEDFSKVEAACATCHQDIHRDRMGVDCARCHTEEGWTVFDTENIHEATNFPIQGRHLLLDCLSCHTGMPTADFRRVWRQCYDCHQSDYEQAANPDHRASGFSTLCQTCHEMTGWTPTLFPDHDTYFPIYSGRHNRKWDRCSDCHVVPGNFKVFECINCHEHNQPDMDSKHRGISGYVYNSPACYQCHPTGEAGDFEEHDALAFPIYSGAHAGTWDACSTCHLNPDNRKDFTCVSCHDHSQQRMDDKHLGEVNDYVFDSNACYECHPNGRTEDDR